MKHQIDNRWLPEAIHNRDWYDVEDITALEVGDIVFDPASWAHYAGRIDYISHTNLMFTIIWYKTTDNVFTGYHTFDQVLKFWWLDPVMQSQANG